MQPAACHSSARPPPPPAQTQSFHEPSAFAPLEGMARQAFAAEVLDGARKKSQSLRPASFAILVGELDEEGGGGGGGGALAAVVEVALQNDADVLTQLPGGGRGVAATRQYAYLSSMAVSPALRRRGAASALLAAAEQQAAAWGQEWLVLHVYASTRGAVQLYTAHGLTVLGQDPAWRSWLGGKVRILMAKRVGGGWPAQAGRADGRGAQAQPGSRTALGASCFAVVRSRGRED
jgi:ribosomal protein S18 acetylase RimI-like enzyme